VEESQLKPHLSQRLMSQPSLSLESKLLRTKRTRLTGSKSPDKVRTSVPTPSGTPVTPNISGIPTFTGEVQQPPKDISTDPSVRVNNYILNQFLLQLIRKVLFPKHLSLQILYLLRHQKYFTDLTVYLFPLV